MIIAKNNFQLQQDVLAVLGRLPGIGAEGIAVRVRNGIVILGGRISNHAQKRAAVQAAVGVPGVRAVVEEIELIRRAPPGQAE